MLVLTITMNKITTKKYITVIEASKLFNKSISTIRKIIEVGKVKYKKEDNRLLIEFESVEKVFGKKEIQPISTNVSTNDNKPNIQDLENLLIKTLKSEIESLKVDKVKLYEDMESQRTSQTQMQKLFENQQTLMLGLQQQIKSLTDNSTQNILENQKSKHVTVEAEVSNRPKTHIKHQNYDLFNESDETPIQEKNTPEKRRKWFWIF